KHYSNVIIFTPNPYDQNWNPLRESKKVHIFDEISNDTLDYVHQEQLAAFIKSKRKMDLLLIIDDYNVQKKHKKALDELATRGRHADSVWKRQSVLIGGRIIEDLNNYNLFTAHKNALSSWETKQHLATTKYYTPGPEDEEDRSAIVATNNAYTVTGSSLSFYQNEIAFPLCLVKGGVTHELTAELTLVTGEQTSISSLMIATSDKTPGDDVDKLNYSDDANIRTVSFQVGTQRFPEGKSISNGSLRDGLVSTVDPEMYALSQRNKDFNNIAFAPTLQDMEGWELNGKKVKHWSLRQNFKSSPDMIGGGLQTLADGRIMINISQYPNPPEPLRTLIPVVLWLQRPAWGFFFLVQSPHSKIKHSTSSGPRIT
ncbi:hypothetical protein PhCBS80983_g06337, partial [Powellomyces hirtus]